MKTNTDVRRNGFQSRATVDEVVLWIDEFAEKAMAERWLESSETESIEVKRAVGRVLAVDVVCPFDLPEFRKSMMDGYAIRSEDFVGASSLNPIRINVIGTVRPGLPTGLRVNQGEGVEITTGSPMPHESDAVLPFEQTYRSGDSVEATSDVARLKNVSPVGEDVKRGETILQKRDHLLPHHVGLLSAMGICNIKVLKRPTVQLLLTGNEVVSSGEPKQDFQIFDSNGPMISTLIERDCGVVSLKYCRDSQADIKSSLKSGHDVTLVVGGSSVGPEDFVPSAVASCGELAFHGIAMRPSSPTGIGIVEGKMVILLPGNPVSCLCAYDFFAGRAIRQLAGIDKNWPYRRRVLPVKEKIAWVFGRVDYCRVAIVDGRVVPVAIRGASLLSTLVQADGFVVVDADSEGFAVGDQVEVFLYS